MDKWKIAVIVLLLGGLFGYGALQQKAAENPVLPDRPPQPEADPKMQKFLGKPAPAWNIPARYWMNTKGRPIALGDLKGSVAVVEFFRTECSHCQEAAPFMNYLRQTYGPRGLKIVSIQSPGNAPVESDWRQVQDTVRQWGWKHPVAFDRKAATFKEKYGGQTYPTVLVLDPQGIVRLAQTGHDAPRAKALEDAIKQAMMGGGTGARREYSSLADK